MSSPFEAFGHRIEHELRAGVAERPLVVFLHALTGDRALLSDCCDAACERRGLARLHLDLPGHGRSTGNREGATADHLVAALAELILASSEHPPLLAGYSYGGYLAQALVGEVRAGGLFLACPVVEPEVPRRARVPRRVARRDAELAFADAHERETFEEIAVVQTAFVLERYRRLVMPASRAADRPFIEALRGRYLLSRNYAGPLSVFDKPTHIICGRHDHWVGFEDQARLARLIPNAALTVLADTGQLLPLEAPALFGAAFEEWLDRSLAASGSASSSAQGK